MRDLLVAETQDLFTDNLRHDHALRLVGQRVVVKKVTSLGRLLFQLVKQLGHAAAVLCADRHDRFKIVEMRVGEDLLHQHFLFAEHVDFVDGEDRRHV